MTRFKRFLLSLYNGDNLLKFLHEKTVNEQVHSLIYITLNYSTFYYRDKI